MDPAIAVMTEAEARAQYASQENAIAAQVATNEAALTPLLQRRLDLIAQIDALMASGGRTGFGGNPIGS